MPTQAAKKIMPQSRLDSLMTVEEWEPLPPVDEEWLKALAALIPNGDQFLADRGFSLEKYRELGEMDFVMKALTDLVEELQEKGYVEMDVTDDDEEEARKKSAEGEGGAGGGFAPGSAGNQAVGSTDSTGFSVDS